MISLKITSVLGKGLNPVSLLKGLNPVSLLSIKGDIMSLFLCEEKIQSALTKYVKICTKWKN